MYVYMYIYRCMYICIYIYVCIYVYIYINVCIYVYIYRCMYICIYIDVCIYVYIWRCMYICIFRQHFFVNANFIEHNRHFMPTYSLLDPFEFPYYFYCIRGELI